METLALECGATATGWRVFVALAYAVLFTRHYLWLRPFALKPKNESKTFVDTR